MEPARPAWASNIVKTLLKLGKLMTVPALCAGTACYQYQTMRPDAVQPGQLVHVDLTAPGAAALASAIGPSATGLNGRVLTRAANDVTLAVTQIERSNAPEQFLKGDPVSFSLDNIAGIQVRSLDKQRTALAIGGVVGAIIVGQVFIDQSGIFTNKNTNSGNTK